MCVRVRERECACVRCVCVRACVRACVCVLFVVLFLFVLCCCVIIAPQKHLHAVCEGCLSISGEGMLWSKEMMLWSKEMNTVPT